jgi:hypothetical protein
MESRGIYAEELTLLLVCEEWVKCIVNTCPRTVRRNSLCTEKSEAGSAIGCLVPDYTVLYGQATTIFHSNFSFERVLKSSFAIDKLGPCLVVGPGRRDHRGSL